MSYATEIEKMRPPAQDIPGDDVPIKHISSADLVQLGQHLDRLFKQYVSDRRLAELRWLRNLRQYLGFYDPEVETSLGKNRSRAYPKITRVKCVSVLSRLMDMMFPGNERNWALKATASEDMSVEDVAEAIKEAQEKDQAAGSQPELDFEYVMDAIQHLADTRAEKLSILIDDQLAELGGDQTYDYVQLNREVVQSGIIYGLGVLEGPYARPTKSITWSIDPATKQPKPKRHTSYKPMFEFRSVWDFYPDMSAKKLHNMDGYFTRVVMSRAQVRDLARRKDFFEDMIKDYLNTHSTGNYRPQPFEQDLRTMGVKGNVNEMKSETMKYEVLVWHGPVSGEFLRLAGVDVAQDKLADDIDAEVWLIDTFVIKSVMNPWVELGVDVKTVHTFLFDEDDTSPVGQGLPNVLRDSQMSIAAATRMMLDNAGVTCGPNLELNTAILRADQDLTAVEPYKIWYRDDEGATSQWPAVRNVPIDSHLQELTQLVELFMKFADVETFVGPATGGDMNKMPSEPMRTLGGASMIRGNAALPFKDVVRSFDKFTESVIQVLVQFNRLLNPDLVPAADINVFARGATSLIAKELRGAQVDSLAQSMRPEEAIHVDMRKMAEARFAVRDMEDMLVSEAEAARRQKAQSDQQDAIQRQAQATAEATVRKLLSDAYKNIAQGQKNQAAADAVAVDATLKILEKGMQPDDTAANSAAPPGPGGSPQADPNGGGGQLPPGNVGAPDGALGPDQGQNGGMPPGGPVQTPGGDAGLQ